ncbi:MAG: UDP-3-O-acyl-N-acetylglucosamine deacetylase [Candidatus Competibacterales bacterium]
MIRQRTLKNAIRATGIGLHTGEKILLTLLPAPANTGIVFRRTDLDATPTIKADPRHVGDTCLATTLVEGAVRISTVEHLLAAFAGLGIDNAIVELNAPEVPILDGSAAPFVFLLQSAGIASQPAPKRFLRIKRAIEVRCGERWARFDPFDGFAVDLSLYFDHPLFLPDGQRRRIEFSTTAFVKELSRARTFGFLRDIEHLRSKGLIRGGSLANAVVLDDYRVLNEDGLRYEDECVRHKILDVIGDLYLLGRTPIGAFTGHRSGHALNNALLRQLLATSDAFEEVTFEDEQAAPISYLQPAQMTA